MEILTTKPDFVAASPTSWQQHLKMAIRDVDQLRQRLGLAESQEENGGSTPRNGAAAQRQAAQVFGTFVPEPYLARIEPGNPLDPLLLQVLPQAAELEGAPGFVPDPLNEQAAERMPGLLQKYAGRVLVVLTGACAVHCRYCFRREFPYEQSPKSLAQWQPVFAEIAADPSLSEVILSGGDPLTLVDESLSTWVAQLSRIEHLRRLRIHTRLPIMIPQRVTPALLDWLAAWPHPVTFVVHVNHPREIDEAVATALAQLRTIPRLQLLNQAVLLRGVNDDVETLAQLSERLLAVGVLPYYLHQLDAVVGAAHFQVPIERGRDIIESLRRQLPGYLVPRYVQEVPHVPYKMWL